METNVISIKLDADSVLKRIVELTDKAKGLGNEIARLDGELKKIDKSDTEELKKKRIEIERTTRELSVNLDMIKALRKEVDSNMTAQGAVAGETTDSIRAMRGELVQLKSVYASMSKEQRESAAGQGIHEQISLLKQQIKEAERFVIVRKEETGSIRQMKAELKELKATYEGLSDVNRNSDIGTGLANQIQHIENVLKRIKADAKMTFDVSGLDLSFAADDDTKSLANLTQRIEVLTAQNKVLMQSIRELNHDEVANADALALVTQAYETNRKEISVLTAERRVLRREVENEMKLHNEEEGSLRALRAEVSRLTSQYDSMSKVRREGAEGTALLEKIQRTTKELNLAEQASLRFQRNVGNYQSAFGNLHFQVQQLARELPSLSYGFNVFIGAISNNLPMLVDEVVRARREYAEMMKTDPSKAVPVWKQLFSAVFNWQTALVAGITILTLYGREVGDWVESLFKGKKALSDIYETTEEFHKAVGGGSGSMLADLEKLSVEWKKLGDNLEDKQKFIKDNAKEFEKLGVSITSVEEAENALIKNQTAFENSLIARAKAAAAMKLAAEEYEKAVQKMVEAEAMPDTKTVWQATTQSIAGGAQGQFVTMENADKKEAMAESNAHFASGDSLIKKAADYSAVEAKILEDANIKAKKANADKVKDAADTATKLRDMKAIELAEFRKAEDELLKLVQDVRAREYKEMEFSYGRQIEDLKARLETEKDLSVEARQAINDQISALEQQRANKRRELSEEALKDQIEAKQAEIEAQLESVEEGTKKEFEIRRQGLFDMEELELKSLELTEAQKEEIRKKYAKKRADLEAEELAEIQKRQAEALHLRFETAMSNDEAEFNRRIEFLKRMGASEYQLNWERASAEVEMLENKLSMMKEMQDKMYQYSWETAEQFNARKAEADKELSAVELEIAGAKTNAQIALLHNLVESTEQMGEHSKAFAKMSKVLALAEIAINTGRALSAAIASAATAGWPGMIPAIATAVATILSNIAAATKAVKSAKFATGGLVEGEGTSTSDSIPAMLSNGESVLTAAATSMFAPVLSAFNQIGGGVPIQATETANSVAGEEMLARAFMRGAASLPNPVVSVVDINAGQTRVAQVETLANL